MIEQAVPAGEYVVCIGTGQGMNPNNLSRSFRRLTDEFREAHPDLGVPESIGIHTLRHSFASNLVGAGANLKVAAAALRHSSVRMMDRYAHLAPETVGQAVRALAEEVGV